MIEFCVFFELLELSLALSQFLSKKVIQLQLRQQIAALADRAYPRVPMPFS
jgi:hypothetical protein